MSELDVIQRAAQEEGLDPPRERSFPWIVLIVSLVVILILAGVAFAIWGLMQPGAPTETWRDIFIILVAFEFMIIGLALIILVIQLARLVNLLNNEVRPILDSASEAASTLRGTARFLSDKLVNPVVKVNAGMAALRRALDLLKFWGR